MTRDCYCDEGRCHMNGGQLQPGFACKVQAQNGGWISIPDDDTDLGECLVGRWYRGKTPQFLAFQRHSPCLGWVERQDFFTHYKPIQPPLVNTPNAPQTEHNKENTMDTPTVDMNEVAFNSAIAWREYAASLERMLMGETIPNDFKFVAGDESVTEPPQAAPQTEVEEM